MDRPLDPLLFSIAGSDFVFGFRALILVLTFVGGAGFIYFWFACVSTWFLEVKNGWKKTRGVASPTIPQTAFHHRFLSNFLKGGLFWLMAGWPLLLVLSGLASEDSLELLLGLDALTLAE